MKKVLIVALFGICTSPVMSQYSRLAMKNTIPPKYTVTIYYCTCTDGGDFSVDSGEVILPEGLRPAYVDALSKRGKLYGTREQIIKRIVRNGYRVSSLRSATVAAWDSLFTPPMRRSDDTIMVDEDRAIQSGYWSRRYRVTGAVVGLDGAYPVFKVQKAARLAENRQEK